MIYVCFRHRCEVSWAENLITNPTKNRYFHAGLEHQSIFCIHDEMIITSLTLNGIVLSKRLLYVGTPESICELIYCFCNVRNMVLGISLVLQFLYNSNHCKCCSSVMREQFEIIAVVLLVMYATNVYATKHISAILLIYKSL